MSLFKNPHATPHVNPHEKPHATPKVLIGLIALAMVMTFAVPSEHAHAQTIEELLAMIAQLQQTIAQLTGGTTGGTMTGIPAGFQFTHDLTVGSTGTDVTYLQTYLVSKGFLTMPAGVAMGYFGSLTKSALAAYQTAQGISPAVGYFGPITRANVNAQLASMPAPTPTPMPGEPSELEGGAGSIDDADFITSLNNEEVGEDSEDVQVAGLEIEASDESDIELTAVTLNFDYADSGADDELDEYAEEVSIWFEGEEVARVDAGTFTDDDNFTRTVTLDSGAVIDAGETGELIVAVSGISNLDSTSAGEKWNVSFPGVRFRDAQNAVITENSTGDIGETDDDTTTDSDERQFSFELQASAADLEFKVSNGDDSINDSRTIGVDNDDDTDDVDFFSFKIEVEGESDVLVKDLPVNFTAVGAGVGDIINAARLMVDGEVIGSESVASSSDTTTTVTFDNIDWAIEAGDTVEVLVVVDVNDLYPVSFTEGDTLTAAINPDDDGVGEDGTWDVEDESGEDLLAADKTGTATTEAHNFYADGVDLDPGADDDAEIHDTTPNAQGGEQGRYDVRFDVTAFGDTLYLPVGATITTSTVDTDDAISYTIENSDGASIGLNGAGLASTSVVIATTADLDGTGGYYIVHEGDTESFTLTITLTPIVDQFYRAQLYGVNFNVGAAAVADTLQQALPTEDYETEYIYVDQ